MLFCTFYKTYCSVAEFAGGLNCPPLEPPVGSGPSGVALFDPPGQTSLKPSSVKCVAIGNRFKSLLSETDLRLLEWSDPRAANARPDNQIRS